MAPVHRNLSTAYLQDFAKYAARVDRDCLERVFEELPAQTGRQTKYTALYPEKRIETIKKCLQVLERASIIRRVRSTTAQGFPLGASTAQRIFKCLFLDIGLVQHFCGLAPADILAEKDLLKTWRGTLAEQFVGQELLAQRGDRKATGSTTGHGRRVAAPRRWTTCSLMTRTGSCRSR